MSKENELHLIQRSFRVVMDAMARPGQVVNLMRSKDTVAQRFGTEDSLAVLVKMFVDQAVSFCVVADETKANLDASDTERTDDAATALAADAVAIEHAIVAETHARVAPCDKAAFIIIPHGTSEGAIEQAIVQANGGTFISPETGATLFLGCESLMPCEERNAEACADTSYYWVSVEGPGVKDSHVFGIDQFNWVWARKRREDEFPLGIEIILVDRKGQIVAVPRSSFLSVLATEGEVASWLM